MNHQSVARDATEAVARGATEVQPAATTGEGPALATDKPARRWFGAGLRLYIVALAGAVAIVVAREWDEWVSAAALQTTDDAYLAADTTPLAAKVPGYVRRMLVRDFQTVKAGDLLVQIGRRRLPRAACPGGGQCRRRPRQLETIDQQKVLQRALIKQAEATIRASEADVTRYQLEAMRQQALLATRLAGTPQATEQAVDNAQRSEATLALNRAQLEQQRQQLNVLDSQERQAKAALGGADVGARPGADQSWLHAHHRAGRRHGRPASRAGRPVPQRRNRR